MVIAFGKIKIASVQDLVLLLVAQVTDLAGTLTLP